MSFIYNHQFTLPALPERVFLALVNPAELETWFAEHAQIEPRLGGVYRFWGRHTLGTPPQDDARQTVSRFETDQALGFYWPLYDVDTDVTMVLAPHERGTTLSLTHRVNGELPVSRAKELIGEHWHTAMRNLAAHLAGATNVSLPDYFGQHR